MPIGRIGQDFIANTEFFSRQGSPSSTALADGRFVLAWNSFDQGDGTGLCVRGRVFNSDGTAAGDDFILNSTGTGTQQSTVVSALPDGRFVAIWQSSDPGDGASECIRARLLNADGDPVDLDFVANSTASGAQAAPTVTALPDGRFVMMWQSTDTGDGSSECIRGRIFGADGAPQGNDFIVNTTTATGQLIPTLTTLADGRFVATWTSNDAGDGSGACVRGRIFNSTGTPAGNDFIVNTTATGSQYISVITALPNGGFVAAWYSEDSGDGSSGCIRARLFNAGGVAPSQDVIVNTVATDAQIDPAVAALADGRYVIAWSSTDPGDGSGSCIRARLFNADGTAAGSDFIVNTSVFGAQAVPAVSALSDGRFVVSWESDEGGEGSSALLGSCIRTQIFDANKFVGTAGEDTWRGSDLFADAINGGGSADSLSGLGGNDQISGDAGNDTVDGGAGNDQLFGGSDNDTLQGGTGADTMSGGSGNDTYTVDSAGDVVIEGAGQGTADIVSALVTYTLTAAAQVERLDTGNSGGTSAQNLTGNGFSQRVVGNDGVNRLDGGGGGDTLEGRGGNDTYVVRNANEVIVEVAGGGTADAVYAVNIGYALSATAQVELLATGDGSGTTALNFYGNGFGQTITGNNGANLISGGGGIDTLRGLGGQDHFLFNAALGPANVDTIFDFVVADDTIRIDDAIFTQAGPANAVLASGAFTSNLTGVATASGHRIIYETDTGKLFYDADGLNGVAGVHFATLTGMPVGLAANDFLVV